MTRVYLSGRSGRMGQVLEALINEREDMIVVEEGEDVIIDFSNFQNFENVINRAVADKVPLVVGTTALTEEHHKLIDQVSNEIPILQSANMSLGINLISGLLEQMVRVLGNDFDIAISERHHINKKDAPSGTALLLLDDLTREGYANKEEITVNAYRGGTIPGDHQVMFMGLDENIEISHHALSRKIFGNGALVAANFILDKENGRYTMRDVLGV